MGDPAPNRIRALCVPEVQFVCEQDGEVERELKTRWAQLLSNQSGIESAYLARVRYGDSPNLAVALCVRVNDAKVAEPVIGQCAAAFVARFGPDQAVDILVLTQTQEPKLRAVCAPFFLAAAKKVKPIVWFELQVAPMELRLAVMPGQPVLFGYDASEGRPAETWLLRPGENPQATRALALGLAEVIRGHPVHRTAAHEPEKCFQPETLKTPSLHLRMAWADGTRWATFHPKESIPPSLQALVAACRRLGMERIASLSCHVLAPAEALREATSPVKHD